MDLGPHAAFIWLCYGAVAIVIVGLIAWLWLDGRRRQQELDLLEAKGVGRGIRSKVDGQSDRAEA
ncbi:MAG: heme exporter protein CcmD [Hyphomicrobiaceae bacterium]